MKIWDSVYIYKKKVNEVLFHNEILNGNPLASRPMFQDRFLPVIWLQRFENWLNSQLWLLKGLVEASVFLLGQLGPEPTQLFPTFCQERGNCVLVQLVCSGHGVD